MKKNKKTLNKISLRLKIVILYLKKYFFLARSKDKTKNLFITVSLLILCCYRYRPVTTYSTSLPNFTDRIPVIFLYLVLNNIFLSKKPK